MVSDSVRASIIDYFNFWPSRDLSIIGLSLFLFAALCVLATTIK